MRLSLLHWQHANLAKVFQRWKEYKGRRAQLFGSLIALACKWEQPLMEDAWAAWRECTIESKRIQVRCETCSLETCLSLQPFVALFVEDRERGPLPLEWAGTGKQKGTVGLALVMSRIKC